jgi:hypothetical protein
MFRDAVLKRLGQEKRENPYIDQKAQGDMIEGIRMAKAIRFNSDALSLVNTYLNELGAEGSLGVVRNTKIAWPMLWLEHDEIDEDGMRSTYGAYIEQNGSAQTCNMFFRLDSDKYGDESPRGIICSYRSIISRLDQEDIVSRDNHFKLEHDMKYPGHNETQTIMNRMTLRMMERAAVLSTLLVNSDLLRLPAAAPVSKLKQQSFIKIRQTPPAHNVQKIDLTDMGRTMYRMRVLGDTGELDDAPAVKGKRRAHWVRDHMFVARNGILTYRKAHVRGLGKLKGGEAKVVASDGLEAPGF